MVLERESFGTGVIAGRSCLDECRVFNRKRFAFKKDFARPVIGLWNSCPRECCCVSWRLSLKPRQDNMQKIGFAEALDSIVASDPRYQRDAYVFLRDALDYTTKQQKKAKGASVRHVAGPELLEGVRQYALKEFGPMVVTVLSYWGIRSC